MDRNTLLPFASFLKYNTDSSIALDLVSYNLMETTKNGRRHFDFAGPDTEIGLVDMKSMKRKRILFLGSAGIILDGKWENDQTILLAGAEDAGNGQIRPIMWRYHLDTYEVEVFSYPRTIKARAGMFYENKYNKVPVKTSPAV
ncbi:MAG: hypothetical protein H0U44_08220 [Flavisolibacter sp.]|nr:hypothetical protein [Flavisolibacter sp.]